MNLGLKCRNPLLIGSTVLTRSALGRVSSCPRLSQSPPNRVNGSHRGKRLRGRDGWQRRNPLLIGSTVLTYIGDAHCARCGRCRNPLLIGSTVLTPAKEDGSVAVKVESQSPPNRVNGSHGDGKYEIRKHGIGSQSPPNRVNGSHGTVISHKVWTDRVAIPS